MAGGNDYAAAVKLAARYLEQYPELKRELAERRAEIEERARQEAFAAARGTGDRGDPTGKRVVELSRLHHMEAWLRAIEQDLLPTLDKTERRILELRWELGRGVRGRPVWSRITSEVHYSERRVKDIWAALAARLAWFAAWRGLYDTWRPGGRKAEAE